MSTFVGVLDFNAAIDKAVFENVAMCERIFQRAALMMLGSIVVGDPPYSPGTPVDTGFARSSWYVMLSGGEAAPAATRFEVDSAGSATDLKTAATGGDPVAESIGIIQEARLGQTIWLVNNVPYIVRLEYGWSKQAPAGMVRLTLAAAQEIVDQAMIIEQSRAAA